MNKEFIRVRTLTDIVVSSILLISGIVLDKETQYPLYDIKKLIG